METLPQKQQPTLLSHLLPQPLQASVPFEKITPDEVELTEEETKAALNKARIEKAASIRMNAYMDKISKPLVYPKISSIELGKIMLKFAKSNIPGFVIDDQNRDIFKLLCMYFTQDPEFEEMGYSLKKGILLFGKIGCGKTTLMRLFSHNVTNDYVVKSVRTVADEYAKAKDGGPLALEKYSQLIEVYPNDHYGQKHIGICFDDLGTENNKKHFGNEINVMEEIFQNRYDNRLIGKTHVTTNLSGQLIEDFYGARVRSRLREMCNTIAFSEDVTDRRK